MFTILFCFSATTSAQSLSQASIVGMSIGISILVIGLAGFLVYKKFGPASQRRSYTESQRGVLSMSDITSSRTSHGSSGSSGSEDTVKHVRNLTSDERPVNSDFTNTTVQFTSNDIVNLE